MRIVYNEVFFKVVVLKRSMKEAVNAQHPADSLLSVKSQQK